MNNTKLISDSDVIRTLDILEEMYPEAKCALDHRDPYELLIAVVLSAQTTDVSVNKVTPALFSRYPRPEDLASADPEDVAELIRSIGLYRNKSKNIVRLAGKLVSEFEGKVPSDFDSLTSLPGVGRKTANVVLAEAFGVPRIAVDTHVFRVANRIGITSAKDTDSTEEMLMRRIPEERWIMSHHLLIYQGRRCCHARKPECGRCPLNPICLHCQCQV